MNRKTITAVALVAALGGCYDPADSCNDDSTAKIGAYNASQKFVSKQLKSPSTADFPKHTAQGVAIGFQKQCHFKVVGYVDSQNTFGGIIRTRYAIDMEADPIDGGHWGRGLILE